MKVIKIIQHIKYLQFCPCKEQNMVNEVAKLLYCSPQPLPLPPLPPPPLPLLLPLLLRGRIIDCVDYI